MQVETSLSQVPTVGTWIYGYKYQSFIRDSSLHVLFMLSSLVGVVALVTMAAVMTPFFSE